MNIQLVAQQYVMVGQFEQLKVLGALVVKYII